MGIKQFLTITFYLMLLVFLWFTGAFYLGYNLMNTITQGSFISGLMLLILLVLTECYLTYRIIKKLLNAITQ